MISGVPEISESNSRVPIIVHSESVVAEGSERDGILQTNRSEILITTELESDGCPLAAVLGSSVW